MAKSKKSRQARYAKAASKCPNGGVRDALTTTWTRGAQRIHANRKLGSFGPASEVVHIDPTTLGSAV